MDLALGQISSPTLMVASQLPEAPEASNGLLVGEAPRRVGVVCWKSRRVVDMMVSFRNFDVV